MSTVNKAADFMEEYEWMKHDTEPSIRTARRVSEIRERRYKAARCHIRRPKNKKRAGGDDTKAVSLIHSGC